MTGPPPIAPTSLAAVARQASRFAQATQLVYGDERSSFADHAADTQALAAVFARRFGIVKGSRVAIVMRNYPEFSTAFWASQLLGAIAAPLNAWWLEAEIAGALDLIGPAVIVADAERRDRVRSWADRAGVPIVTVRSPDDRGALQVDALIEAGAQLAPVAETEVGPGDPSTLLFTSGTTGFPKAVVHTHGNHIANLERTLALRQKPSAGAPSVQLATMPLFHITQLATLYINAAQGGATILMHKWDAASAAELIEAHRVTHMLGVPMQVEQLLDVAAAGRDLSSLVSLGIGATVVPPHLPARIWSCFAGRVAPVTGYGSTETTSTVATISGAAFVDHPDSAGKPHPFNELRLITDEGCEAGVGEVGEITVRGPNVTTLEWTGQVVTPVRSPADYFATGDLGRFDEEGFLYIVGRSKDVINRSGENVHGGEIEAAIAAHPAVHSVAVVGMPHPVWGEEVTAIIQPHATADLDVNEMRAFLAGRLAHFKVPTRIHFTDEAFPTTSTGKVRKAELRSRFIDEGYDGKSAL